MKLHRAEDVQKLVEAIEEVLMPAADSSPFHIAALNRLYRESLVFHKVKPIEISEQFDENEAESMWSKLRIMRKVWTWMEGTRWQHDQIMKKLRGEG